MKYFPRHCKLTTPRPLLLLVDDDPLIVEALGFALANDFDVVSSPSRAHCRQLLPQLRKLPDAALIDLGLPPLPHRPDDCAFRPER